MAEMQPLYPQRVMATTTNFAGLPKDGLVYYKGDMITREERDRRRAEDQNSQEATPPEPQVPDEAPPQADESHPIPYQLQGCRFILLQKDSKDPVKGVGWKDQDYGYDSPVLIEHIRKNHNYGVKVAGGLCVIDCDHLMGLFDDPFFETLMKTFFVKTGKEKDKKSGEPRTGCHFYIRCPDYPPEKKPLRLEDGTDLGDIRGSDSNKYYVVGPGSIHPDTGNRYEVKNDVEPLTVSLAELEAFVARHRKEPKAMTLPNRGRSEPTGESIADRLDLRVGDFLMPEDPQPREHQIEGIHPVHGSNTGTNLIIDPVANQWFCRRCHSGGGPLEALAVAEGIVDCSHFDVDGNPGLSDHWSAIFDALKKRGYKKQLAEMDRVRRGLKAPEIQDAAEDPTPPPAEAVENPNALPEIVVNGRDMQEVTEDVLWAMKLHNHPARTFVRAGGLVRIEFDEKGMPKIACLTNDAVRGRMARAAHYVRVLKDSTKTTVYPPKDITADVMALGEWPFPPLRGVIEAPTIRPDGTVITTPGYDEATKLYYAPTQAFREYNFSVPESPTQEEIEEARQTLNEIICDFPFVDMPSRVNWIAAMITPVVRNMIDGPVPMGLINKPQPGTGGSLLTEIIELIYTGREAPMKSAPTSPEEWRKFITATLVDGRLVVPLDNINDKLFSAVLALLLTASTWQDRILGKSEIITLDHRCVWVGNGNNIQLGGDLPRRCYWIQLDAQMAMPQERSGFRHESIKKYVLAHRPEIISAVLVLARSWVAAGAPEPAALPRMGSYEEWVRTLGGILSHAGYTGFLENQRQMYEENDNDNPQWEAFLHAWHDIWGEKPVTAATVQKKLDHDEHFIEALPDYLADAYLEKSKSFVRVLGRALSGRKDMRFPSGVYLTVARIDHKIKQWKVVKTGLEVNS